LIFESKAIETYFLHHFNANVSGIIHSVGGVAAHGQIGTRMVGNNKNYQESRLAVLKSKFKSSVCTNSKGPFSPVFP